MNRQKLKAMLEERDSSFFQHLAECIRSADAFEDLVFLSALTKKALAKNFHRQHSPLQKLRVAILGGFTFYPLSEILQLLFLAEGYELELWTGAYDNYVFEINDEKSSLFSFRPDLIVFLPPAWKYRYSGSLSDENGAAEKDITANREFILSLCAQAHKRSSAEIILCNFRLPCSFDPGSLRTRKLTSEWNSLKSLNLQIGLKAPAYVHICDLEFLSFRYGGLQAKDSRAWFESKQPFSCDFMCVAAREILHIALSLKKPAKKVLVMDLDDTLWGGTIGEDGVQGIEIGDTSPRGQCFKEFQRHIQELSQRGVLLAVCSKNDEQTALHAFDNHPEMVLRREDLASFRINWKPKPENLMAMAEELNLSLDSFVFIDDNPAEIEMMRQFAPEVSALRLPADPAEYVDSLKDSRYFESQQLTHEDFQRKEQYAGDEKRKALRHSLADMSSYLESLDMEARICDFKLADVPRITQLINKSNQFNLTLRRRSEAEVTELLGSNNVCLSLRLKDRFGDLGLVCVLIAAPYEQNALVIDTFLLSCRVLQRQVEHLAMNALIERAAACQADRVIGLYRPSEKNQLVAGFYEGMGFVEVGAENEYTRWEISASSFRPFHTRIRNKHDQT